MIFDFTLFDHLNLKESPNSAPEKRKRLTLNFFRRSTKKNKKEVKQEEEEEKISPTETIVEEIEIRMTDSKDESPQNSEPEELVVENIEEVFNLDP